MIILGPMSPDILYERVSQFVKRYGGRPPKYSSPRALDMLSDFALAGGFEWEMRAVPKTDRDESGEAG